MPTLNSREPSTTLPNWLIKSAVGLVLLATGYGGGAAVGGGDGFSSTDQLYVRDLAREEAHEVVSLEAPYLADKRTIAADLESHGSQLDLLRDTLATINDRLARIETKIERR